MMSLEFEELEYLVRSELNSCVFKNSLLKPFSYQVKVSFYEKGFIFKNLVVNTNIKKTGRDKGEMSLCIERLSKRSEEIYKLIVEGKFLGIAFLEQKRGCTPWLEGEGFPIKKLKFIFPNHVACPRFSEEKLRSLQNSF